MQDLMRGLLRRTCSRVVVPNTMKVKVVGEDEVR